MCNMTATEIFVTFRDTYKVQYANEGQRRDLTGRLGSSQTDTLS